jgi:hypothetical protein
MFYYISFIILLILSGFGFWAVHTKLLIPYPEEERVSLREGSTHSRPGIFFYHPSRRFPSGGDGFGFGK